MDDIYHQCPIKILYWVVTRPQWESIYEWYEHIKTYDGQWGFSASQCKPILEVVAFLDTIYLKEYNEKNPPHKNNTARH